MKEFFAHTIEGKPVEEWQGQKWFKYKVRRFKYE